MAASAPQTSNAPVLNSWKEIANYLGRGVRTVQRYERDLGLPVRRPHGRSRSAVIAIPAELDEWLRIAPKLEEHESPQSVNRPPVVMALRKSIGNTVELRQVCDELRAANQEAMKTLLHSIQRMQELLQFGAKIRERSAFVSERGGSGSSKPSKPN